MTAETIIRENTRFDRGGSPLEVVIPYEKFVEFVEEYGLDLSDEGRQAIHKAKVDREAGNTEAFMNLKDFKESL